MFLLFHCVSFSFLTGGRSSCKWRTQVQAPVLAPCWSATVLMYGEFKRGYTAYINWAELWHAVYLWVWSSVWAILHDVFVGWVFTFLQTAHTENQFLLRALYFDILSVIFSAWNESLCGNTKSFSLSLPNSLETSSLTFTLSVAMDTSSKAADWRQQ